MSTSSISTGCGNIHSSGTAQGEPRPILTSVIPARVPRKPTRRSHLMASNIPPAISEPVIAAMIGFETFRIAVCMGSRINVKMSMPPRARISAACLRSRPAENTPQSVDVRMTTRAEGSASARAHASVSPFIASTDRAFLRSGRSIVTVTIPSSTR